MFSFNISKYLNELSTNNNICVDNKKKIITYIKKNKIRNFN